VTASSGQEAKANGEAVGTYDQGMCQKYVRGPCWEVGSLYGSAIDAWNGATEKHPGDRTPPIGAPMYYRGGQYGHAVICVGEGGRIRSTDCTSPYDVSSTDIDWPTRTWGYTYLGWTGDINGVDLPLSEGDEDMPLSNDDVQKVAEAVWNKLLTGQPDGQDRYAWATLVNTYNDTHAVPEDVWETRLMGQRDAPDGRYASATLSNIHNMLVELTKKQ
jgi:hypothetical protein